MSESICPSFPCPRCQQPSYWSNNIFRPFCSERCKLLDLGAWASEQYRIATQDFKSQDTPEYDQD